MALRSTQRVPRSCTQCSSRKVKCDKAEPCGTCIRRGESHLCLRETVLIRGEPKIWQDLRRDTSSSEQSLLQQIDSLKEEISLLRQDARRASPGALPRTADTQLLPRLHNHQDRDVIEDALWSSLESRTDVPGPQVTDWDDVIVPSRALSSHLIAYDRMWNAWVHYAVEYPLFQQQCDEFMDAMEDDLSLADYDYFWMAVYFSLISAAILMMDDKEAEALLTSNDVRIDLDVKHLARNWYDAALFSLHRADFMRVSHICTVQAVAILGICFNIFGDTTLGHHLWGIAIRVGRHLGLNTPTSDRAGRMTTEAQHRLWWTITICEWLETPHKSPQIDEVDFDVPLPQPSCTDTIQDPDPAHYHLFMARTARVYYRFRKELRAGLLAADVVVRAADEELALVIDTLPRHLQPGGTEVPMSVSGPQEPAQAWIKWQRFDITLVLLHHRTRINRILRHDWLTCPGKYAWARAICIQSSFEMIWISRNWDQPMSMRKQWALSFHLFFAGAVLIREWRESYDGRGHEYAGKVREALGILEQLQSRNEFAHHAVDVLRSHVPTGG